MLISVYLHRSSDNQWNDLTDSIGLSLSYLMIKQYCFRFRADPDDCLPTIKYKTHKSDYGLISFFTFIRYNQIIMISQTRGVHPWKKQMSASGLWQQLLSASISLPIKRVSSAISRYHLLWKHPITSFDQTYFFGNAFFNELMEFFFSLRFLWNHCKYVNISYNY